MGRHRGILSLIGTWIIPLLGALTATLGITGWVDHGQSFVEAAYRSIALFDIGNDFYTSAPGSTDWRFLLGRWTALLAIFGTALVAIAALLHERLALFVARWTKQEVIVIGSDGISATAFDTARRARKSVLWLGASALGPGSMRNIALPWPPGDYAKTVFEHAARADHVLVADADDARAIVLARAARRAAPKAHITVLMRDIHLAKETASALNAPLTRVLSLGGVSARTLVLEHPPFLLAQAAGHGRIHALIVGFGQTGQAIAKDLIVNCLTTHLRHPRITVIDPEAGAAEGVLRTVVPEVDECAHFHFIQGRLGSEAIEPPSAQMARAIAEAGPLTCAYVCVGHDTDALSAAALLQTLLLTNDLGRPPIFVRLRDSSTVDGAASASRGLNALIPFGDLDNVLEASEYLSDTPDKAARSYSEAYRASLTPASRDDPANTSARPWDDLDETFRQANRDAVAHIPAKMASAGIDPAYWRGVVGMPRPDPATRLFRDQAECERLAELEHDRWNAQRRMDGWRWADLPGKDEARRLHPSLVPYECLADDVKEYDRVYIRNTQTICWGADAHAAEGA
jgi:hypothetical protein